MTGFVDAELSTKQRFMRLCDWTLSDAGLSILHAMRHPIQSIAYVVGRLADSSFWSIDEHGCMGSPA